MTDSGKAVFLSYASQDAEAARRICDALRAASVEVWFDQSELRGGDAWDQKIRRQIRECALFVPLITPNTNARQEGYFRLEWKLAVDRSHLMADDAAFLFPIVVGDVSDANARVPDKFREVQWTRLRLDETPAELAARVATLLRGAGAGGADAGSSVPPAMRRGIRRSESRWWVIFPIVGTLIGLAFTVVPLRKAWQGPSKRAPPAMAPAASEARQLAARARAMSVDKYDSSMDDFTTAEGLVKRALELEPNDGEIWAASSLLNFAFNSRGFDRSTARTAAARTQAERALKLAPDSIEALFAHGRWQRDNEDPLVAEATLKRVLEKAPDHVGALHNLGYLYDRMDRVEEAAALYAREAQHPGSAALAGYTEFLMHFRRARFAEAERAVRKSIAAGPAANSQSGLAMLLLTATGDAEAAAQAMATGPVSLRREHRPIWTAAYVHLCRQQPEEALRVLARLVDDYILDNFYTGPKAYFVGLAHAQAGRGEAARVAWEEGLAVVDQRMRSAPADRSLRLARGELLARLGREEDALREARTLEQLGAANETWIFTPVRIYAALGRAADALPIIEQQLQFAREHRNLGWHLTPALLRIDPRWEKLRGDPRFQALLAQAAPVRSGAAAPPGEKSVGVLAFRQLSADPENEYLCEAISDELCNVLGRVPGLKVAASASSFTFRGSKRVRPEEMAAQLGVAYLVDGEAMNDINKAVFLSYASQDADAAQRWRQRRAETTGRLSANPPVSGANPALKSGNGVARFQTWSNAPPTCEESAPG